jgi:3-oxoisoapionate decarboxylase
MLFPDFSSSYLKTLRQKLDDYGFDRVYAWGHPDGLEAGGNEKAKVETISQRGRRGPSMVNKSLN